MGTPSLSRPHLYDTPLELLIATHTRQAISHFQEFAEFRLWLMKSYPSCNTQLKCYLLQEAF